MVKKNCTDAISPPQLHNLDDSHQFSRALQPAPRRTSWLNLFQNLRWLGLPQFGKFPGPQHRNQQSACASQNHCRHRPKPVRRDSRFELPELIRSADEHHLDCIHAAAHFIRRAQLHQRASCNYADHIRRAHEEKGGQRKHEIV